jgi:NTF2-like protein (DUF6841)
MTNEMTNAGSLAEEMQAFYREYIDAFNCEDLTGLAGLFSYPWGVVTGKRGLSVIKDEAEFFRVLSKMKASLQSRGWARTGIEMTHGWPTGNDTGLLIADYVRYRSDGSVLERGRASYTLRRDAGQWKIVAMMEISAPFPGPGDIPR